jgi:hypothetical protein
MFFSIVMITAVSQKRFLLTVFLFWGIILAAAMVCRLPISPKGLFDDGASQKFLSDTQY